MFREHHAGVRAYALRRVPAELAQDAIAETFLVAWRRFDDVPADALPWLYGVTRRTLANQRRSVARGEALVERIGTGMEAGGGCDPAEAAGDADVVRRALGRLSDRDRETLMLVAWDGLSGPRAAAAVGCTHTAFKVRLHRARARLAKELRALDGHVVDPRPPDSIEVG
jgi:RNA polymerase sigma-70 factor (ECF subfamily)